MTCNARDCDTTACSFRLGFGPLPLPWLCCDDLDRLMQKLADEVPDAEGRAGLAQFRADHDGFHAEVAS